MYTNNIIFAVFLAVFGIFFYKYFSHILLKHNPKLLIDDEFKKPQAFHESPVLITGGIGIFFSFLILCLYSFLSKQTIYI